MKLRKSSIIFVGVSVMLLSSIAVSADKTESDPSGDVYYFNGVDADVIWEFYGERDHIDVTDAAYSISGSDITVSLTVKDSISNHQKIKYYIILKSDITSYYAFDYTNESGMATGNGDLAGYVDINPDFIISADGKTISYTYSDVDTSLDYTLKAYAVEYLTYGITYGEAWYDYIPDSEASYYTGGDDNNNTPGPTRTPGFEVISILAAIGITFIILKRKK